MYYWRYDVCLMWLWNRVDAPTEDLSWIPETNTPAEDPSRRTELRLSVLVLSSGLLFGSSSRILSSGPHLLWPTFSYAFVRWGPDLSTRAKAPSRRPEHTSRRLRTRAETPSKIPELKTRAEGPSWNWGPELTRACVTLDANHLRCFLIWPRCCGALIGFIELQVKLIWN